MKIALSALWLCMAGMAFAQDSTAGASAPNTRFDGTWKVTLVAPNYKDAHGTALGFTYDFTAQVKDGAIHGEHGEKGKPAWLAVEGTIQADGSALLTANGVTGNATYSAGGVASGTKFTYHIKAQFEGAKGTGSRVEGRTVNFTFVKQ